MIKKRIRNIPCGKTLLLSGNEAAAIGVMLSRVQGIAAYPITPQTVIVERLADYTSGREDVIFKNLDSEHSMLAYAAGMAFCGIRVFTASSSQGLLYALEQVNRISRDRIPMIMAIANRSLTSPWSLEPDFNDSMAMRDSGWLQFYCVNNQEVLDTIPFAYKIAETLMLPVLVCEEGFLLSHTRELVIVPSQEDVDVFLPPFIPPDGWGLDPDKPRALSQLPTPSQYMYFQKNLEDAMESAEDIIEKYANEFSKIFLREKIGCIEVCGNPKSSRALITMGTIGETAQLLLEEYDDILLVRIHAFRPFPKKAVKKALENVEHITVIDRAVSFGSAPPLAADIFAYCREKSRHITGFVTGIGGVSVTEKILKKLVDKSKTMDNGKIHWIDATGEVMAA